MKTVVQALPALLVLLCWPAVAVQPFGTNGGSVDFVDLVKQISGWTSSSPLDSNGWPQSDNSVVLIDARQNMPWDGPDPTAVAPDRSGTYHLSFTGQATLTASTEWGSGATIQNQSYNSTTNTTTAELVLAPAHYLLILNLANTQRLPTDPPGTGFTNLRVMRPGFGVGTTQLFTSNTLRAYAQPFAAIRFLDTDGANNYAAFCGSNGQLTSATWANRVHVTDAYQGGLPSANSGCDQAWGYAWEYMIMLANMSHHDMWINVPVDAGDTYVQQLATLILNGNSVTSGLSPDLHVYVEYSNEVWNPGFPQQQYNQTLAQQEGISEPERYVEHSIQIAQIFRRVWGPNSLNQRVKVVDLWQYTTALTMQEALSWAETHFDQPVKNFLWGIGEAPYYNPTDTSSVGNILDTLWTGSDQARRDFIGWQAVAAYFGIKEVGYESGPSLSAYSIYASGIPAADRDPRIQASIIHHYLDNWYAVGCDLVNFFSIRGTVSAFGDWFLYEDSSVFWRFNEPKLAAVQQVMSASQPAITAGYVLPWTAGATANIDPSQYMAFPFTSDNLPGSGLTIYPLGSGDPAFDTFEYLLRTTASGTYTVSLYGRADGAGAQVLVYLDDSQLGTVQLPQGPSSYSTPIPVTLQPGFHALYLVGAGTANTILPAGIGKIQIKATTASGPPTPPSAPQNLTANTVNASQISLIWAPTTTASSYTVKRSLQSGGPYAAVSTTASNVFTDSNLTDGTTYYYAVTATNHAGESAPSPQAPAVPTAPNPPAAPTGLSYKADASFTLSNGSNGFLAGAEVALRWNKTPEAVSYTINRTPCQTGGYTGPCAIGTQLANVTTYVDIGQVFYPPDPQAGVTYTYTVQANNAFGSSPLSAPVNVTPAEQLPAAPTGLAAQARGTSVYLHWKPPFGILPMFNPMQFNVYRGTTSGGPYTLVGQISTANFLDTTVTSGTPYYYVVSAAKDIGEGPKSAEVSVTP